MGSLLEGSLILVSTQLPLSVAILSIRCSPLISTQIMPSANVTQSTPSSMWVQIWHTLGVDEIDINEIILLAVNCYLPDWQGEAVHNWSPSAPRPLRGVWEGTGAGQGQLRL